ncbi:MAG: histidine triad nucleotide-binding protein [Candidatus Ryanbacteria bacterium RIFCSPHIGHO2_02_FULL_45_13b]|uniref:Histidine triad nucleotide-binding protein n=1 Tax=Candidatus Ryanbacteria bacterium RIFCSPHIGHO2_02_FULL_45_13b TaxID=1802117 RepID=A0A1G2G9R0_9BACT|nr:MAG: histidine triad nucleotide-binding protein [Candidatus Ryanbacteria bacterium RIFCSPHIGHO2_02_FULL_45_13b]
MERDCVFCDIVLSKIPSEIVRRSNDLVVFKDIKPKAPVHLLIVPTKHVQSIKDLTEEDRMLMSDMIYMARDMAEEQGLEGYRLSVNVGREGGQVVDHLHLHLLGGWSNSQPDL